jgi:hypothetical protein
MFRPHCSINSCRDNFVQILNLVLTEEMPQRPLVLNYYKIRSYLND